MYKELFENKKVAIFDLETITSGIRDIQENVFSETLKNLQIDWVYLPDIIKDGDTMGEIWEKILLDPYIKIKIPVEQLLSNTNTKFKEVLDKKESLDVLNGFWELVDELKNDHKYKIVLKSEFNKVVTQTLLEKLDLEGIFDLVVVHNEEKKKGDLYKEILSTLKKHGFTNKECLAFERSPKRCVESTKKDIETIAIRENSIPGDDFPYKVTEYHGDFTDFPGNIDKTYLETFEEAHSWKKE